MTVGEVFDRLDYTDPEDDEELRYKLLGEWTYEQFSYIPREREGFRYHRLDVRISDMQPKAHRQAHRAPAAGGAGRGCGR